MNEESKETEENPVEMGPDHQDHRDHQDHQDRSFTGAQADLSPVVALLDLRVDPVYLVRLDSLAPLDLKETAESLVCQDTLRRGKRESPG